MVPLQLPELHEYVYYHDHLRHHQSQKHSGAQVRRPFDMVSTEVHRLTRSSPTKPIAMIIIFPNYSDCFWSVSVLGSKGETPNKKGGM